MAEHARLFMSLTSESSGEIKGESVIPAMRDWIELEDWNWSIKAAGSVGELPEPSLLTIRKRMDRASTAMLQAMDRGTALTAIIKVEDSTQQMFALTLRLEKVRFTNYRLSLKVSEKSGEIEESWELNYRTLDFQFRPDKKSGAVAVMLERAADATTDSAAEKEREFMALAKDMKVQEIKTIFDKVIKAAEERGKEGSGEKTGDKDSEKDGG